MVPLLLSLFSATVLCGKMVTRLPGFTGPLPFHLETGYERVESWELFYYFVQSEGNPREDPVILWFNGGPGCSSLNGLAFEIGPLRFVSSEYNGSLPTLVYNPFSWTKFASIIFLDYPIGTGFSFSSHTVYHELSDTITSIQCYKFLKKWYDSHPQFLSNPLYMAGDSYGGKMVPIVTQHIADGIGNDVHPFINLKGYLIGNPLTSKAIDENSRVKYAYGVGILSKELYKEIERTCAGEEYYHTNNKQCISLMDKFKKLLAEIDAKWILGPKCPDLGEKFMNSHLLLPTPVDPIVKCKTYAYFLSNIWANDDSTREALHIKKGSVDSWTRCNADMFIQYDQDIKSAVKYHLNLTRRGYRALVYSGDKDLGIPFVGTLVWIKSLNFSVVEDWRSWHVNSQVAGYTERYANNLTFATVKNAGHIAPEYQPEACFAMFERWISREPL